MKTEMQVLERLSALIPDGVRPYLRETSVSSDFTALNVRIDFPDPDSMRKDNMLYIVPEYENIEELTTSSDTAQLEAKLYIISKKGTGEALIRRVFDIYTAFYLFMRNNPTLDGFIDLSRITDMDYFPSVTPSGTSTAIEVTLLLSWEKVYQGE